MESKNGELHIKYEPTIVQTFSESMNKKKNIHSTQQNGIELDVVNLHTGRLGVGK